MPRYFGSKSYTGTSVDSGSSGRVQFGENSYAEAYSVRDGKGDSEMYARVTDSAGHVVRTIEVKEDSDLNYDPAVTALGSSGSFVVAWTNSDDDDAATDTHVLARVYGSDGARASSVLAVSGNGSQHADEASVAGLSEKQFVIAYENDTTRTVHVATYTQNSRGAWIGSDKVIDASVGSNGGDPVVTRLSDTSFSVLYTDANGSQTTYRGATSAGASSASASSAMEHLSSTVFGSDTAPAPIGHTMSSLADDLLFAGHHANLIAP